MTDKTFEEFNEIANDIIIADIGLPKSDSEYPNGMGLRDVIKILTKHYKNSIDKQKVIDAINKIEIGILTGGFNMAKDSLKRAKEELGLE